MAGAYGQLGRSLGTAVGSFFDPRAQQAGELAGLQQQQLIGQIEQNRLKNAELQQQQQMRAPESVISRTLMGMGLPTDAAPQVQTWLQSGSLDRYSNPNAGPTEPAPDWYNPATRTKIGQQFAGAQAVQAGEARDLKDYFEGQGASAMNTAVAQALAKGDVAQVAQLQSKDPMKVVQSMLAARIGSGEVDRNTGGGRMAAIEGRPLYHTNEAGAVLDQYGGALDTSNPLAGAVIGLRNQQAAQAKAGAAENYAQAGAANARAQLTRQEMSDAKAAGGKGQYDAARGVIVDPRTGIATPVTMRDGGVLPDRSTGTGGGKLSESQQKVADAKDVLALLDQADPLLSKATGSRIGNIVDIGMQAVGQSNPGAQAAAQLKALEGMLISKMPKMSGPQSDKDVLLYKQMAGQIGDPNIPEATKRAAITTIRQINERYAGVSAPGAPAAGMVQDGYRFKGGNPADPSSWERVR